MVNLPLVSCLCVTFGRPRSLLRSVDCFREQSYDNKELVIQYQDNDSDTIKVLQNVKDTNIRCVSVPAALNLSLGAKRNICIEETRGDYICTWDDDDWYHRERITAQVSAMIQNHKQVCILLNITFYDEVGRQAYASHLWPWEGTMICSRKLFASFKYKNCNKSEDSHLMRSLLSNNLVYPLIHPLLYIYSYSGQNTWDHDHFKALYEKGKPMPAVVASIIEAIFDNKISHCEASQELFKPHVLREIDYLHWAAKIFERLSFE